LSAVVDAGRADAVAVAARGQVVTEKSGQSEKWKDKKKINTERETKCILFDIKPFVLALSPSRWSINVYNVQQRYNPTKDMLIVWTLRIAFG
jgi:hypothetical protein